MDGTATRMASSRSAVFLALGLLLVPTSGAAQGSALAAIRGIATAGDTGVLVQAVVVLRHEASGRTMQVLTDEAGRYTLTNVLAGGPYTLTIRAFGHATKSLQGVQLQPGATHRIDVELEQSAVALPQVEVHVAAGGRFDAARTGAATMVDRAELASHPTVDRNVLELAALSPMAARAGGGLTIAGQNARFNALQIDGARYQDMFGAAADGAPGSLANARPLPLDAVEQFQVLVAPFDVRHSGFTGGLLNVITRGGTNAWEAGAFGYYRDRSFAGDITAAAQSVDAPGIRNALAGVSIGGPIARDRVHVFASLELEQRTSATSGYNVGSADAFASRIAPDSAARFVDILHDVHGTVAGSAGQINLDNPRENFFVRLDWQLGAHRLLLRHNHAAARREVEPNRTGVGTYELGSQLFTHGTSSRATSLQLLSSLSPRWSNELLVNVHRIRDSTTPAVHGAAIEVDVISRFDTTFVRRRMRAGGHLDAQANRLTQSGVEIRSAVTGAFGSHVLTFGGSAELMRFNSLYTHNPDGRYYFRSLADLEANRPASFERTLSLPGADARTVFDVAHVSAFIQDEWSPIDQLTLHAGMRVDIPVLQGRPDENAALLDTLGVSTATLPRTTPMWSPRVGFNWMSTARLRTQLRGGAGLFAGRPAYAWLADAYTQTGLRSAMLYCDEASTPAFSSGTPPGACADPAADPDPARPAGRAEIRSSPIVLFDEAFRFPQDLRVAAGIDQAMPFGIVLSGDLVLGVARRQVFLRDINLGDAIAVTEHGAGYTDGFGFERRPAYGTPSVYGFETVRRADGFHQVIVLTDDAENRALAASVELSGVVKEISFRGAYTWTRSLDVQSLTHRNSAANFASVAVPGDPNAPAAARSDFDRPHRVLLSLSHVLRVAGGTELSLLYVGESGTPYTYVYGLDINGDAAPGPGLAESFNDPLYVPPLLSTFPGTLGSAAAFDALLRAEPCLAASRGTILRRNECRSPAVHRLDLRASHAVRVLGADVRFVADMMNVLDLIGSRYGNVQTVPPLVPILGVESPRTTNLLGPPPPHLVPLSAWYAGPRVRDGDGSVRLLAPGTIDTSASRWQAQIGIEIRL